MNILIIVEGGKVAAVYTSGMAHSFVLDYNELNHDLTTREQQCIMLGFPYNANPEHWDLDEQPVDNRKQLELAAAKLQLHHRHLSEWAECQVCQTPNIEISQPV
jgi:hypothetical protein